MDIWRWVVDYAETLAQGGDARLARLLMTLPEAACDDRHAEVDAMVPEALALVRAQKHPWAEVYVRHWHLQSKILHRYRVKESLAEAVSLLEFANRPETRDCPQSVCVTQDLTCAYGYLDGPGYAAERLAVAAETLERIDPSWPCFDCISGEYAAALMDAGQNRDALEFVDGQRKKLLAHDEFELGGNLSRRRALALLELGQPEAALEQLESWDAKEEGNYRELGKRTITARCLLRLGQVDSAQEELPEPDEIAPTPGLYEEWLTALIDFVDADAVDNNWQVGGIMRMMQRTLEHRGAMYLSAWSALHGARLALDRGATVTAELFLEQARARVPELRRPEAMAAMLAGLEQRLAELGPAAGAGSAAPSGTAGEAMQEILDRCGADPEADLEALAPFIPRSWPTWPAGVPVTRRSDVIMQYTGALIAMSWPERARELLRAYALHHPEDTEALESLIPVFLDDGGHDAALELVDELVARDNDAAGRAAFLWMRARILHDRGGPGDGEPCRAVLCELLEKNPGMDRAALLLAQLERARGDHAAALQLLEPLVAADKEPGDADWECMIAGTLAGAWQAVRDSARRLGMDVPGQGPIAEPGGLCRIRLSGEDGRSVLCFAERISPVSARIIEITGPGAAEHYGDIVVFDPTPEEPDTELYTFSALAVAEPGRFSGYVLDGAHPGAERVAALEARLGDLGGVVQVRSGGDYELIPDGADEPLPGIFALIAVHATVTARALHELLRDETASWPHPVTWLHLAKTLGDPDEERRQLAISAHYNL